MYSIYFIFYKLINCCLYNVSVNASIIISLFSVDNLQSRVYIYIYIYIYVVEIANYSNCENKNR